jgi:hypothetical protein
VDTISSNVRSFTDATLFLLYQWGMGKKAKKGDGAVRPEDVQGGEFIRCVERGKEGGREGTAGGTHTYETTPYSHALPQASPLTTCRRLPSIRAGTYTFGRLKGWGICESGTNPPSFPPSLLSSLVLP